MPSSSKHLPDEDTRRKKAIGMAGKKVHKLLAGFEDQADFDTDTDKGFSTKVFDWVSEAELRPTSARESERHQLGEIFEDLILELNFDELGQYAREEEGGQYFNKAWKNGDAFRKTQQYFKDADASTTGWVVEYVYNKQSGLNNLHSETNSPEGITWAIDKIKTDIAEFEHHLGAYRDALEYRQKAVGMARSAIKAIMSVNKGRAFTEINEPEELDLGDYLKQCLTGTKQQDLAGDKLADALDQFDFNHPLLRDHIQSAANDAFTMDGFDPKAMDNYFKALEKSTDIKIKGCGDIISYCTNTRKQIDRIVDREMQKQGLGK